MKTRRWILMVSLLTIGSAFVLHLNATLNLYEMSEIEDRAHLMKVRALVGWQLYFNVGLAVAYVSLWWWAKRKPHLASWAALALLLVVTIIEAAINLEGLLSSGIVVNGFFVVALLKAISVGQKEQAQLESMPKAQVRNVA
jgi:hypothetical protein